MTADRAFKIFVSYSRKDAARADLLVAALEAEGFDVTIDRRDLPYGEEWQAELAHFIRRSDTVVWLVSPHSVVSRWCLWELGEVQRLKKRLVPVVIEPVTPEALPETLGRLHLLPSTGVFNVRSHLSDLVRALNTDNSWLKEHTRLAERALLWRAAGRNRDQLLRGSALAAAETWCDRKPTGAPPPSDEILDLLFASRQAESRRQRQIVAGALSVAVIAVVLSGVALWQRTEALNQSRIAEEQTVRALEQQELAEQQRALAQANEARALEQEALAEARAQEAEEARARAQQALDDATSTANNVVLTLAENFRQLGLPLPVSSLILTEARALQDKLAQHALDNPRLTWGHAAALAAIADTLGAQGDAAGAEATYRESLAVARQLPDHVAEYGDAREIKATIALKLGDLLRRTGQPEDARKAYTLTAGHSLNLTKEYPSSSSALFRLSGALLGLGDIENGKGNTDLALATYQRALSVNRAALSLSPNDSAILSGAALVLSRMAEIHRQDGHYQSAFQFIIEGAEVHLKLMELESDNTLWFENAARGFIQASELALTHEGTISESVEGMLDASQSILSHLTDLDPSNGDWQFLTARTLALQGRSRMLVGDLQEAYDLMADSSMILHELYESNADNPILISEFLASFDRVTSVLLELGQRDVALSVAQGQLKLAEELAKSTLREEWIDQIAWSKIKMGLFQTEMAASEGSLEGIREGVSTIREEISKYPGDPNLKIIIAIGLLAIDLAENPDATGRSPQAIEARAIIEQLEASGSPLAQRPGIKPDLLYFLGRIQI